MITLFNFAVYWETAIAFVVVLCIVPVCLVGAYLKRWWHR